jgi:hypothetical protein
LWCDVYCHDSDSHPNGFWVHDNLLVNNGRAGVRFEQVGDVADAGEALIENNEVHGNSKDALRGGVAIHDAQDALVQNNVFGAATIADVGYLPNSEGVAIRATDSGRSDRPDLWNVDIVGNVLNGEVIKGCELPDEIVDCSEQAQPPPPTDTTPPETTIVSGPSGTVKQKDARFTFSSEPNSTFECKLDGAAFSACVSPTRYTGLVNGFHTFEVRATDAAGNTDPSPASRAWIVQR